MAEEALIYVLRVGVAVMSHLMLIYYFALTSYCISYSSYQIRNIGLLLLSVRKDYTLSFAFCYVHTKHKMH